MTRTKISVGMHGKGWVFQQSESLLSVVWSAFDWPFWPIHLHSLGSTRTTHLIWKWSIRWVVVIDFSSRVRVILMIQYRALNKFNEYACDIHFTGVDHLSEGLSEPPTFTEVDFEAPEWVLPCIVVVFCSRNGAHRVGVVSTCFDRYPEDYRLHMEVLPPIPKIKKSGESKLLFSDATARRVEF